MTAALAAVVVTQSSSPDWVDLWLADAPQAQITAAYRVQREADRVERMYERLGELHRHYTPRRHAFQRAVLADAVRARKPNRSLIRGLRRALRRGAEPRPNRGYEIASAPSASLSREAIAALQMLAEARGLYLIVGQHQTRLRNLETPLTREARFAVAASFRTLANWRGA
jgi:hypothetical protein